MKIGLKVNFNNAGTFANLAGNAKKILLTAGKNAFLFILIFILLEIILGQFLFYQYAFLANTTVSEVALPFVTFNENTYQSVLKEMNDRQNAFNSLTNENYNNPFK